MPSNEKLKTKNLFNGEALKPETLKHELFLHTAIQAGLAILKIYNEDSYIIEKKQDNSPVTTADLAANEIINKNLLNTGLPILSEENKTIPYYERKDWNEFVLVDPLDGTKEFINRNGEFTVNIAVIRNNYPVFGAIYAPVPDVLYWGSEENGSWRLGNASEISEMGLLSKGIANKLSVKDQKIPKNIIKVIASKSHFSDETKAYIEDLEKSGKEIKLVSKGSSLKFCLIAEGSAHIYPRLGPTMEWDTAAGHAIAKFAGYTVKKYKSDKELEYNKEDLLNPWFVVY